MFLIINLIFIEYVNPMACGDQYRPLISHSWQDLKDYSHIGHSPR